MSDEVDMAFEAEQLLIKEALANVKATEPKLPPKGCCYNCDEPLGTGERFCDVDCREDYDHRQRRRLANRGP